MAILTYRCHGHGDNNPVFESKTGKCPTCKKPATLQTASGRNDDGPNWVDAKPPASRVTPELSGELDGADDRPVPEPDLTSSMSGWCGKPEDRPN